MRRYRFIHAERARYPIAVLCRVLRIARSAYYAWARRGVSARCPGRLVYPQADPGTLGPGLPTDRTGWTKRPTQDQEGNVLDILVQARRDKRAAVTFLRRLLKGLAYVPRMVITDKLASYGAAMREVLPSVEHRRHKGLNNRAENAHQPTRERERRMRRFKDPGHAQRFLAAHGPIASHCQPAPPPADRRRLS